MTPADLTTIVRELRAAIVVPQERRLWGIAEVMDYCGFSRTTVESKVVNQPDFPDAIRVDRGSPPRWPAAEVMEWFEGRRR